MKTLALAIALAFASITFAPIATTPAEAGIKTLAKKYAQKRGNPGWSRSNPYN